MGTITHFILFINKYRRIVRYTYYTYYMSVIHYELTPEEEMLFSEKYEMMNRLFPKLPFCADTDHLDIF